MTRLAVMALAMFRVSDRDVFVHSDALVNHNAHLGVDIAKIEAARHAGRGQRIRADHRTRPIGRVDIGRAGTGSVDSHLVNEFDKFALAHALLAQTHAHRRRRLSGRGFSRLRLQIGNEAGRLAGRPLPRIDAGDAAVGMPGGITERAEIVAHPVLRDRHRDPREIVVKLLGDQLLGRLGNIVIRRARQRLIEIDGDDDAVFAAGRRIAAQDNLLLNRPLHVGLQHRDLLASGRRQLRHGAGGGDHVCRRLERGAIVARHQRASAHRATSRQQRRQHNETTHDKPRTNAPRWLLIPRHSFAKWKVARRCS